MFMVKDLTLNYALIKFEYFISAILLAVPKAMW